MTVLEVQLQPRAAEAGGVGLTADAFGRVYAEHMPALTRYCRSILRDSEDAEDAAQNAMERALKALTGGAAPPARMRPWLLTIAQREAVTLLRRRKRSVPAEIDDVVLRGRASGEELESVRERLAELLADLHALAPRQREALVQRELGGLSYREIAASLEISDGAAQQVVLEARQSLQHFAEGRSLHCDDVQAWLSNNDHTRVRTRRVRAHLRGCRCCETFQSAIGARRRGLGLLLPGIGGGGAIGQWLAGLFGAGAAKLTGAGAVAITGAALLATLPSGPVQRSAAVARPAPAPVTTTTTAAAAAQQARAVASTQKLKLPARTPKRRAARSGPLTPPGKVEEAVAPAGAAASEPASQPAAEQASAPALASEPAPPAAAPPPPVVQLPERETVVEHLETTLEQVVAPVRETVERLDPVVDGLLRK